ncbi:metallophosphoesterase family protein [Catenovulum sediminis]|uniref:metallophosphoesterase family protein n=1 Tax=Catenovulum sediminis TaxID=1740262 RepID=UPI0011816FF0|nr:metallophosphoesterase [Catenovulum sediminis]
MKKILHISDLHLSDVNNGYPVADSANLIEMLLLDVLNVTTKIDSIFFTGDITFNGSSEQFSAFNECILIPLLKHFELTFDDFFFVPGNHDIQRSEVSFVEKSVRKTISFDEVNKLSNDVNNGIEKWNRIANFNQFKSSILSEVNNLIYDKELITIRNLTEHVVVICLNSAWFAQDEEDFQNLRIFKQFKIALETVSSKKKVFCLMHHPLGWFHPDEIKEISSLIEKRVDALFFGHMHEFNQSLEVTFGEDITLRLQAGTLDTRNSRSGFSIIEFDSSSDLTDGRIHFRKYCNESQGFKPWSERCSEGTSSFSLSNAYTFDSVGFMNISEQVKEQVELNHISNVGRLDSDKIKLSDIFVPPSFTKTSASDDIIKVKNLSNMDALFSSTGINIITGSEREGKSFLLKFIYLNYLKKQAIGDFTNIVLYANARAQEFNNDNQLLRCLMDDYCSKDQMTSFEAKIKRAVINGNAIIILDNIDFANAKSQKVISIFINKYQNNTYYFSSDESNFCDLPSMYSNFCDISLAKATLGAVGRSDIRRYIALRPSLEKYGSQQEIFNNIIGVVNNSQLPHNHFIYTILLVIYENRKEVIGILNEADIIENYIEILLHKHKFDPNPNKPQYKNLIHFLGHLAHEMLKRKTLKINVNDAYKVAIQYDDELVNGFKVETYFTPLVSSGILIECNGAYEFSYDCFWSYFLAYYMTVNSTLKGKILTSQSFLKFDKVIEYYSSMESSSDEVIKFLIKEVKNTRNLINDKVLKSQNVDVEEIELGQNNNISVLDLASQQKEFEQKIKAFTLDLEKRDRELDEVEPLNNRPTRSIDIADDREDDDIDENDNSSLIPDSISYKRQLTLCKRLMN